MTTMEFNVVRLRELSSTATNKNLLKKGHLVHRKHLRKGKRGKPSPKKCLPLTQ